MVAKNNLEKSVFTDFATFKAMEQTESMVENLNPFRNEFMLRSKCQQQVSGSYNFSLLKITHEDRFKEYEYTTIQCDFKTETVVNIFFIR